MVRLLGDHRARRLLLRGERLDASTALAWGLLDELTEPEWLAATAERWVGEFARASRTSMAGIKAALALLSHSGGATEAAVRAAFDAAFICADFAEGAAA
ncbi:MAG: enoyl-CoA hydratase/isomerase family protein, partial [Betaproteobacteria bacterium]